MARIKIVDILLADALKGHLQWCSSMNYSKNTLIGYETVGKLFLRQVGNKVFSKITVQDVEAFMQWAVETPVNPDGAAKRGTRKRRPKTLRNYQIVLASLWTWGVEHNFAKLHVLHQMKPIRVPEEPIEPLTPEEIVRLVKATEESRPWKNSPLTTNRRSTAIRDKMIIHLLLDTMVRASEAVSLRIEDVAFHQVGGEVRVIEGKGGKTRIAPFSKRCAKAISHYLLTRPGHLPTDYLLVNDSSDTPMSRENLCKLITRLGKKAGISRVSPHRLRTTGACERVRHGVAPFDLSRVMGHSSITTTQRYVRAAPLDLHDRLLSTSPMDNLRL